METFCLNRYFWYENIINDNLHRFTVCKNSTLYDKKIPYHFQDAQCTQMNKIETLKLLLTQ